MYSCLNLGMKKIYSPVLWFQWNTMRKNGHLVTVYFNIQLFVYPFFKETNICIMHLLQAAFFFKNKPEFNVSGLCAFRRELWKYGRQHFITGKMK